MTKKMIQKPFAISLTLCLWATACGNSDSSGPQPEMCYAANVTAAEVNNYSFSSTITLPDVKVKAKANLHFDWSMVSKDFLGHSLSTTSDLNMAAVMLFQLPLAELQQKLNDDNLEQSDLVTPVPASWPPPNMTTNGATSTDLYDFQLNGTPVTQDQFDMYFDPSMYPPSGYSYLAAVSTGTTLGQGFRMLQAFSLDPQAAATTVTLTNSSTRLSYTANLHALTITGVPGGTPNLTLDWTDINTPANMKKNALGAAFKENYITSAIVGHYTQSPRELEAKFLDLELIATELYTADIPSGSTLDFSMLKEKTTKNAFPGVDSNGTWLVGLICGNCRNPAPWYMTVLKPCAAK